MRGNQADHLLCAASALKQAYVGAHLGVGRGAPAQSAGGTKRHMSDSEEALKRQRALQEKSKRAQKRYRERKKVLKTWPARCSVPFNHCHGRQRRKML